MGMNELAAFLHLQVHWVYAYGIRIVCRLPASSSLLDIKKPENIKTVHINTVFRFFITLVNAKRLREELNIPFILEVAASNVLGIY